MSKMVPLLLQGSTISRSTSRSILCNLSGTGSRKRLCKFLCLSGIDRSFASAWRHTMRAPALATLDRRPYRH
jgi:hypothetical protein